MSHALGAAFLSHQVEQLEKTVTNSGNGNWRERRPPSAHNHANHGEPKRARGAGPKGPQRRDVDTDYNVAEEKLKRRDEYKVRKDADIVVVDASVLVHALSQVKKWCREGREEVLIVPLEGVSSHLQVSLLCSSPRCAQP